MSGYAATARLDGIRILPGACLRVAADHQLAAAPDFEALGEGATIDREPVPSLADRVHYARQGWSQMTFYLFDPQSWR